MNQTCFALKGGTAINLFVRNMPRLSVDIDLTYLPIESRDATLTGIDEALKRIAQQIRRAIPGSTVQESRPKGSIRIAKLFVSTADAQIVIEPNLVIRGTVFPNEEHTLVAEAEDLFELSVTARTLSFADLYGGKICAALDRQHPRDLYDVKLLLDEQGFTDDVRKAFVVYLASHPRPINELLAPVRNDIKQIYENELAGMIRTPASIDELVAAREALIDIVVTSLSDAERAFLISLKTGEPDWMQLGIPGVDALPAIQWKLENIRRMSHAKHAIQLARLKAALGAD